MIEKLGNNSLVVIKNGKIIFSSDKDRLRPIIICINQNKLAMQNSIILDKVIGLAAAKLLVYAKVKEIYSLVASRSAVSYLSENGISIKAEKVVDKILNNDKSDLCPMEKLAETMTEKELFEKLNK